MDYVLNIPKNTIYHIYHDTQRTYAYDYAENCKAELLGSFEYTDEALSAREEKQGKRDGCDSQRCNGQRTENAIQCVNYTIVQIVDVVKARRNY